MGRRDETNESMSDSEEERLSSTTATPTTNTRTTTNTDECAHNPSLLNAVATLTEGADEDVMVETITEEEEGGNDVNRLAFCCTFLVSFLVDGYFVFYFIF